MKNIYIHVLEKTNMSVEIIGLILEFILKLLKIRKPRNKSLRLYEITGEKRNIIT